MGRRGLAIAGIVSCALSSCGRVERSAGAGDSIEHTVRAGPVVVAVRAEPARLTIAERVTLSFTMRSDAGTTITWPEVPEEFGGFTVARRETPPATMSADGGIVERRTFLLEPFLAGEYEVPSLTVAYRDAAGVAGEIATPMVKIAVASVLGEAEPDVAPARGEVAAERTVWWPWVGACVAAVAAGGTAYAFVLLRRRSLAVPAHESPETRLGEIAREGGGVAALARIAPLVRAVLAVRAIPGAATMTTEQLAVNEAVRALPPLDETALRRALAESDAARFGGIEADDARVRAAAGEALAAVRIVVARSEAASPRETTLTGSDAAAAPAGVGA